LKVSASRSKIEDYLIVVHFFANEQVRRSNLFRRKLDLEEVRYFGSTSNRKQAYFAKSGFLLHFGDSPHLSVTSAGINGSYVLAPWEWLVLTEEDFSRVL